MLSETNPTPATQPPSVPSGLVELAADPRRDPRNWMSLATSIHDLPLRSICLPATHDSGTYKLRNQLVPGEAGSKILDAMKGIEGSLKSIPVLGGSLGDIVEKITENVFDSIKGLTKTTSKSIAEQLEDGIRCLDLRIYYSGSRFYTYHGLVGTPLTDVLEEVRSFLASTRGEIVYITMTHFSGVDEEDFLKLANTVLQSLEDYAYLPVMNGDTISNNPFDQTYSQIVHQSGTAKSMVILVCDKDLGSPAFWPEEFSPPDEDRNMEYLAGRYTETNSLKKMISSQKDGYDEIFTELEPPASPVPFALYMTLTPDDSDYAAVIAANLADGVEDVLEDVLPGFLVTDWLVDKVTEIILDALGLDDVPGIDWKTLRELSETVDSDLVDLVQDQILQRSTGENALSFIYVDFYERSKLVDLAIRLSVGFKPAGNAVSFNGSGAGYIQVPASSSLDPGDALTISAWVFLSPDAPDNMKVVSTNGFILGIGPGGMEYRTIYPEFWDTDGNRTYFLAGKIPLGRWSLLTATWQKGGSVTASINGVQAGSAPVSDLPLKAGDPIELGIFPDLQSFALSGFLGPVRLLESNGTAMADWRMDQRSGTTVTDSSGNGNDGTIEGEGVTWAEAPGLSLLTFNGEGAGYVEIRSSPSLAPGDSVTLSAWVYLMEDCPQNMKVIAKDGEMILGIGTGGDGYRSLFPEFWDTGGNYYTFQNGQIPFGKWTLLTVTWQRNRSMTGAIDGVQVGSVVTQDFPLSSSQAPVYLGIYPDQVSFAYDGWLGPVGIFSGSSAAAFWPLGEGRGTTIQDLSGNANNGEIVGAGVSWDAPIPSTALAFDGSGQAHVQVPSSSSLSPGDSLTVTAWVNLTAGGPPDMKVVATDGFILGIGVGDGSSRSLYPEVFTVDGNHYTFQTGSIPFGVWTFLKVTWQQGGSLTGFINNQQVESIPAGTAALANSQSPLCLGIGVDQRSFPFSGQLGAVTLLGPSGVMADWPVNEGDGTVIDDRSGNGNNGTITGTSGATWSDLDAEAATAEA